VDDTPTRPRIDSLRYSIPVSGVIGSTDDTSPFAVRYREPYLTLVANAYGCESASYAICRPDLSGDTPVAADFPLMQGLWSEAYTQPSSEMDVAGIVRSAAHNSS
jgi:hypothetical protein